MGSGQDSGKNKDDPKYKNGRKGNTGIDTRPLGVAQIGKPVTSLKHKLFKPKDLVPIPWMVAIALQSDRWYLRQDIIWNKPSCMPESVKDRCTKSHEYIFMLTKSAKYYYDHIAIMEDSIDPESYISRRPRNAHQMNNVDPDNYKFRGSVDKNGKLKHGQTYPKRNKRSVWTINTRNFKGAHFAVFPPELPRTCILAGSKAGDTIIDPFGGAMTTLMVAQQLNRKGIGIELNEDYIKMGINRLSQSYFSFG